MLIIWVIFFLSQLVHGNSGNMSTALQQMQARSSLNAVTTLTIYKLGYCSVFFNYYFEFFLCFHHYDKKVDKLSFQDIKGEVNIGASPKNLPMDSSVYRQAILQSKSGLGSGGVITASPLQYFI